MSSFIPQYGAAPAAYSSLGNYGPRAQNLLGLPDLGTENGALAGFQLPAQGGITDLMSGSGGGITALMAPTATAGASGGGWMSGLSDWGKGSGFLGSTSADGIKTDGWGGQALGLVQGLGNAFMGMKQYGLAKEQLAEGKRQFQANYDAQKTTTNTALEDRQRARVASNAGGYQSVGAYMAQNGIK